MNPPSSAGIDVARVVEEVRRREVNLIDRLRALVEIESPSSDKAGVDRAQTLFAAWAESAGGTIRRACRFEPHATAFPDRACSI